ncbi:pyridine nucleotide-disulfide oxidoreductase domain-containing protein 1 [Venturia canescens]|uniref:pyridine nucleotide-disulfide oxidoreductase domain-containing protein 1 n=1 Tax=Venturia canescens TaxID=32260 RepID=UPI001C9D08AE|nr:pyridine nucleotide-disulfide oxidoreductase domain-containing protein 1 [Venturia canescens]
MVRTKNLKIMSSESLRGKFVIVGGGIAGVSCAESLAFLAPEARVILITASSLIKAVTNVVPLGTTVMKFDVKEENNKVLSDKHPSIKVIHDTVIKVNTSDKTLETSNGEIIGYEKLCVCTGAKPRLICEDNEHVIGIRDMESVETLSQKIRAARRILVVGNGGIATEVVHEIEGLEVIWVIKDKHISATFVDPGAAEFFQDKLLKNVNETTTEKTREMKRIKYTIVDGNTSKNGPALGPDWHSKFMIKGNSTLPTKVKVEYETEVAEILKSSELVDQSSNENWPVWAKLTNGKTIGCDFIISATGVSPNSNLPGLENLVKSEDGGYSVDWEMKTSENEIYAAGDVCTVNWQLAKHWFQMRLWTQAHQMGRYAAKSMYSSSANETFHQDFCFELFTHVTNFFGYKVVLLGLFNGQKLAGNYEILLRMTRGLEYIKLVMKNGKMEGAVLIGETDLEEMCENLILNQLDLSIYGKHLLDPNIDIEDYFD